MPSGEVALWGDGLFTNCFLRLRPSLLQPTSSLFLSVILQKAEFALPPILFGEGILFA
jgi:hypothetical protein